MEVGPPDFLGNAFVKGCIRGAKIKHDAFNFNNESQCSTQASWLRQLLPLGRPEPTSKLVPPVHIDTVGDENIGNTKHESLAVAGGTIAGVERNESKKGDPLYSGAPFCES